MTPLPTAAYGAVLAMSAVGYILLERAIIAANGRTSRLATAVGRDLKSNLSLLAYVTAIPIAFFNTWISVDH